ncbi:MAG TPA: amidohydrolase family protein, partial [Pyrinomonadaceae bacterium]
EYVGAWRDLFGYKHADMSEAHLRELVQAKARVMKERGDGYSAWVLDQLGIETMLANRVAMGRGLVEARFRWVPFDDALLFPLNNEAAKRSNSDVRGFYASEERLLKRYMADAAVGALPQTFDAYLSKVVTPTLERQRRGGAVAIKFEAAYLRPLDFSSGSRDEARRTYERYARGGEPAPAEYKALQDFLFRFVAGEAGRLGMAVHLHMGAGAGSYFSLAGSNPILLEPVLNDPTLRKTNFVLVHGGWPWVKETAFLLGKPNVYADFSSQTFLLPPRQLSETLRTWLETYPEKILFGTDAFALTPEVGWEEVAWLSSTTARRALTAALAGMMSDGEITRERALELARMTLRGNALKLYGFKEQQK